MWVIACVRMQRNGKTNSCHERGSLSWNGPHSCGSGWPHWRLKTESMLPSHVARLPSRIGTGGHFPGEHICLSISMVTTLVQTTSVSRATAWFPKRIYPQLLALLLFIQFPLCSRHSVKETMPLKILQLSPCFKPPSTSSGDLPCLGPLEFTVPSGWRVCHIFGSVSFLRFA